MQRSALAALACLQSICKPCGGTPGLAGVRTTTTRNWHSQALALQAWPWLVSGMWYFFDG